MKERLAALVRPLTSMRLTLVCFVLAMILIFFGTLAQVPLGTYAAQKKYFDGFWVWAELPGGGEIPVFPGGLAIGALWFVNLVAAHLSRFKMSWKKSGIVLTHFGLILLLLGQFFTQLLTKEGQMAIDEGATKNYSESPHRTELVVIDKSAPAADTVVAVPEARFRRKGPLSHPALPVTLVVKEFYPNAVLGMKAPGAAPGPATEGVGARIDVQPAPPTGADDEVNNVTAVVEVLDGEKSLGVWLLSAGFGAPQGFVKDGRAYELAVRPERYYYPFRLTLKDFRHDKYLGTDVPKNFSSLVRLQHPEENEDRDVLIYMNHPLRYDGKAFYQASFGKNDTLSVLQVVENPAWLTPYISALLVALGLLVQFLMHLTAFARKRA